MQKILNKRLSELESLKDPAHVRLAAISLMRITLQHCCVCLAEWVISTLNAHPEKIGDYKDVNLNDFVAPADGTLVALLTELLVAAENLGWKTISKAYWDTFDTTPDLKNLVNGPKVSIEALLKAFVENRNNSVEGHGIAGDFDRNADIAMLKCFVNRMNALLPTIIRDGSAFELKIPGEHLPLSIKTLKPVNGKLIVYRKLKITAGAKVKVDAQVQDSLLKRSDFSYEAENVLLALPARTAPEYRICETEEKTWGPFVYIPDRLSSPEEFTGRSDGLEALAAWADDSDSRVCMVYGDGGVGKTTMVVEFLHRWLEKKINIGWQPEIITFYTAKKTRWGLSGLEHIMAQDVGVTDAAVSIARMLSTEKLDRAWFDRDASAVVQKLGALQTEYKINRDSHLIILDNTETMAKSDEDIAALAKQIKELSKRAGRIILTSRRRESLEALPIEIKSWNEEEGAEFLNKRGARLNCRSVVQAGNPTLKKYSRSLGNKPIVLEVFVQAASMPGIGLEAAFQRVQSMQRQDLGLFLYADAWNRFNPQLRHILLLLTRISDVHDEYSMQLCCMAAEVSVMTAFEAIEESKGIGSISTFDGRNQVVFNTEFHSFCAERIEEIDGVQRPTVEKIEWVKRKYAEYVRNATAEVRDRTMQAFRVPYAKAAWQCYQDGDIEKSLEFYSLAEQKDPENGWLYDRYARTLLMHKNLPLALDKAKRSTSILPKNAQSWFTRGMIEGRLGLVDNALTSLANAEGFGMESHLCSLQKAYAHVYRKPSDIASAQIELDRVSKAIPNNRFTAKISAEVNAFQKRWLTSS